MAGTHCRGAVGRAATTRTSRRAASHKHAATSAVAGLLAFGLSPLIVAPSVQAELDVTDLFDAVSWSAPAELASSTADLDFAGALLAPLLNLVNQPFVVLFGRDLIGNGITAGDPLADGTAWDGVNNSLFGSSGAFGSLHDGGFLLGDGGAGTAAHLDANGQLVAAGAGGNAGLIGNGGVGGAGLDAGIADQTPIAASTGGEGGIGGWLFGDGGAGGAGGAGNADAVGGNGGDGGAGVGLFASGGAGGKAGNGGTITDLPALGGAGGQGGLFGNHGGVGHFGTLAQTPTQTPGLISTAGTWITDNTGRVVILHGTNEVYKTAPFTPSAEGFDDDDAAFLAANGFNAVRVGVEWAAVEPQPGVIDYAYLAAIDETVQTLARHGIVSLLDMHQDLYSDIDGAGNGAPAWATDTGGYEHVDAPFPFGYAVDPAQNHAWDAFWSNAKAPDGIGLQNHYARMFEAVAHYFADSPSVAGYEIMNEPWPGGAHWLPSLFGSPHFDAQTLTAFYSQVTSAIRAVDPTTPVFYEPTVLTQLLVPPKIGMIDDPHTVLSFHDYCPTTGLGDLASLCGMLVDIQLHNAVNVANAHGVPSLLTEFGAVDSYDTMTHLLHTADKSMVGWLQWAYNEAWVWDLKKPPVDGNVNMTMLTTMAQPYPQAIAGTPNSWSFGEGTFQLSYSTAMASGAGHFPGGSQTNISVPTVNFPNGYQVQVTGGHVVSAADAPMLVIASDSGASTVNVSVSAR